MSNLSDLLGGGGGGQVLEFTASSALTDGELVSLGSDGTVSSFVSGSRSVGTADDFNTSDTNYADVAYDPVNNKLVTVYQDQDFSSYGAAVVSGSVSGTTVGGHGTKVIYESSQVERQSIVYDSANGKMVICYDNPGAGGSIGKGIVGTVSGTSISFGSSTQFGSGNVELPAALYIPSLGKIAVAYYVGIVGYTTVGTVSGTSISFSSQVANGLVNNNYNYSMAYDTGAERLVVAGRNDSTGYPEVVIGSFNGTSFNSWGTSFTLGTTSSQFVQVVYDSKAGACLAYGFANPINVFTISGLTYDEKVTTTFTANPVPEAAVYSPLASATTMFYNNSGTDMRNYTITINDNLTCTIVTNSDFTMGCQLAFNQELGFGEMTDGRIALAYGDGTSRGYDQIYQEAYNTYDGFIGISDGAYLDAATATIQVVGAVDDAQSGLTPGYKYYVSSSGTLTTSAASGIFVGTAISSTEILIKG
jgi:hypothetical protein